MECAAADAGLDGSLRLGCFFGVLNVDVSECTPKCITSRRARTVLAGTVVQARAPVDLPAGESLWVPCSNLLTGFDGSALFQCEGGVLSVSVAKCSPMPCTVSPGTVYVRLGGKSGLAALSEELTSGSFGEFDCASVNMEFSGKGALFCLEGRLIADPSGCTCVAQACRDLPCLTGFHVSVRVDRTVGSFMPPFELASGSSTTLDCSSGLTGYQGTLVLLCMSGTVSANPGGCISTVCRPSSAPAHVEVGGLSRHLQPPWGIDSGGSFDHPCMDVNVGYEGAVNVMCIEGVLHADASACQPRGCSDTARNVSVEGLTFSVSVPGTYFGTDLRFPVPSGWRGEADCELLHPEVSGRFTSKCSLGLGFIDATSCIRSCMPPQIVTFSLGSGTRSITIAERGLGGYIKRLSCRTFDLEWDGTLLVTCDHGAYVANTDSCLRVCPQSQPFIVTLGSMSRTGLLNNELSGTGGSSQWTCSAFVAGFSGNVEVTCNAGALSVDVSGCAEILDEPVSVTVIKSAMSMDMPVASGTDFADVQTAMDTPESHRAVAASIAAGLGVAEDTVKILSVSVEAARRLSMTPEHRNLQQAVGLSFLVSVQYQVEALAAARAGLREDDLGKRIVGLANASSPENNKFKQAIGPNLAEAATQNSSSTHVLASVAQEVSDRGVVVRSAEPPLAVVEEVRRPVATLVGQAESDSDGVPLLWAGFAAGLGLLALACCGAFYCFSRKNLHAHRIMPDPNSNIAPASPAEHLEPEMDDVPDLTPANRLLAGARSEPSGISPQCPELPEFLGLKSRSSAQPSMPPEPAPLLLEDFSASPRAAADGAARPSSSISTT